MGKKRLIAIAGVIFVVALVFRVIYFLEFKESIYFRQPTLDAEFYDISAQSIASGTGPGNIVFLMNPGYSYFLAIIYFVFGRNLPLVVLLQFITGAISCVLVFLIGAKVFNRSVGMVAGLISSVYIVSIFYEGFLLPHSLINFCNLMAILLLITSSGYFFAGLLLGLSVLLKASAMLFIPMCCVWVLAIERFSKSPAGNPAGGPPDERRTGINKLFWFLLGFIIVVLPCLVRNSIVSKKIILSTTVHSGWNFYIGNNPESKGILITPIGETRKPAVPSEEYRREASSRLKREVSYAESSTYWFLKGGRFILNEPVKWIKLLGRKFILFWNAYEIPTNCHYYFLREQLQFLRMPVVSFLFSWSVIGSLGLFGIILATISNRPRNKSSILSKSGRRGLIYSFIIANILTALLFFAASEYRLPVVPVIIIFCAYTIVSFIEYLRNNILPAVSANKNSWKIPVYLTGLILAGLFVNLPLLKGNFAVAYLNSGYLYLKEGNYNKSIEFYKNALLTDPNFVSAYTSLGDVHSLLGRYEESLSAYNRALDINPFQIDSYLGIGTIYKDTGKFKEALEIYKKGLKNNPEGWEIYYNIGNTYLHTAEYDKAIESYKKAILLNEGFVHSYINMGVAYVKKNQYKTALEVYESALRFDPQNSELFTNLGYVHYLEGDYIQAVEMYKKALDINPENKVARKYFLLSIKKLEHKPGLKSGLNE